jgi:hypothetical protein
MPALRCATLPTRSVDLCLDVRHRAFTVFIEEIDSFRERFTHLAESGATVAHLEAEAISVYDKVRGRAAGCTLVFCMR